MVRDVAWGDPVLEVKGKFTFAVGVKRIVECNAFKV